MTDEELQRFSKVFRKLLPEAKPYRHTCVVPTRKVDITVLDAVEAAEWKRRRMLCSLCQWFLREEDRRIEKLAE